MPVKLPHYLGGGYRDESVQLPDPDTVEWETQWAAAHTSLIQQLRAPTIERAAIILPNLGLTLNNNQQAEWNLDSLQAFNPHVVNLERFMYSLNDKEEVTGSLTPIICDGTLWDLYVNTMSSPKKLTMRNSSGQTKIVTGFIWFLQVDNYINGIGTFE